MGEGDNCFDVLDVSNAYLEVELVEPPDPYNVAQNQTFTVNTTVTCRVGFCGNVSGRLRYNGSSSDPDTDIPTTYSEPFYIMDNPNPQNCSNNPLEAGEYCELTWTVNATGSVGSSYKIGVLFESNIPEVPDNYTSNSTVQIVSCILDITLQWDNISFGFLDPGTENKSAPGNDDERYNITVESTTTCNIDLYIQGNDLQRVLGGGYVIGVGNITWSDENNDYDTSHALDYTWSLISADVPPGTNTTTYYWINVPYSILEGEYNGTLTIEGVEEGENP